MKLEMKTEILRILREDGGFVSGQQLCDHFQVSRTAVWKSIRQLEEEGCVIEAVRNKGYRLTESPELMTEAEIGSRLQTKKAGRRLVLLPVTDSTNIQAKRLAEAGCPDGTLVVSDCQTAGKGRRGRSWSSPAGKNVFMSLVLRPELLPSHASMITLVMGMAVARAVCEVTGETAQIKWPNDVVAEGRKICGILTEMSAELEGVHYIITGIGINVNQESFPEEISETAVSLKQLTGQAVDRNLLIAVVMNHFEAYYDRFLQDGDMSGLKQDYEDMLANAGREVKVLDPAGAYEGTCLGITDTGELLVETKDHKQKEILSGEVSVRGIYGYI